MGTSRRALLISAASSTPELSASILVKTHFQLWYPAPDAKTSVTQALILSHNDCLKCRSKTICTQVSFLSNTVSRVFRTLSAESFKHCLQGCTQVSFEHCLQSLRPQQQSEVCPANTASSVLPTPCLQRYLTLNSLLNAQQLLNTILTLTTVS